MDFQTIPPRFRELGLSGVHTNDGFWMAEKPLADLLLEKNIRTFPNDQGRSGSAPCFSTTGTCMPSRTGRAGSIPW